jgi:hypothetical protein
MNNTGYAARGGEEIFPPGILPVLTTPLKKCYFIQQFIVTDIKNFILRIFLKIILKNSAYRFPPRSILPEIHTTDERQCH